MHLSGFAVASQPVKYSTIGICHGTAFNPFASSINPVFREMPSTAIVLGRGIRQIGLLPHTHGCASQRGTLSQTACLHDFMPANLPPVALLLSLSVTHKHII